MDFLENFLDFELCVLNIKRKDCRLCTAVVDWTQALWSSELCCWSLIALFPCTKGSRLALTEKEALYHVAKWNWLFLPFPGALLLLSLLCCAPRTGHWDLLTPWTRRCLPSHHHSSLSWPLVGASRAWRGVFMLLLSWMCTNVYSFASFHVSQQCLSTSDTVCEGTWLFYVARAALLPCKWG